MSSFGLSLIFVLTIVTKERLNKHETRHTKEVKRKRNVSLKETKTSSILTQTNHMLLVLYLTIVKKVNVNFKDLFSEPN